MSWLPVCPRPSTPRPSTPRASRTGCGRARGVAPRLGSLPSSSQSGVLASDSDHHTHIDTYAQIHVALHTRRRQHRVSPRKLETHSCNLYLHARTQGRGSVAATGGWRYDGSKAVCRFAACGSLPPLQPLCAGSPRVGGGSCLTPSVGKGH